MRYIKVDSWRVKSGLAPLEHLEPTVEPLHHFEL